MVAEKEKREKSERKEKINQYKNDVLVQGFFFVHSCRAPALVCIAYTSNLINVYIYEDSISNSYNPMGLPGKRWNNISKCRVSH